VLTERAADTLAKVLRSFGHKKRHRAWTITGVYGTGKSAFAHFLSSLLAPRTSPIQQQAAAIVRSHFPPDSEPLRSLDKLPQQGCVLAIATGQREPISWTIVRALARGAEQFWQHHAGTKPPILETLLGWENELNYGVLSATDKNILRSLKALIKATDSPLLIIIDELGKNLDYASQHQGIADLYLLQQLAELKTEGKHQVYFLGLLHQSFGGYSDRLTAKEQSEWIKVQGRFEDILFRDAPSQMTRLIAQVLAGGQKAEIQSVVHNWAQEWCDSLREPLPRLDLTVETLGHCYPLHPLTALALPILCLRYAQNDRSLFTFLTSDEPFGLMRFLTENEVNTDQLPTLKLHQLYDYFVESVTGLTSRFNVQRWVEVQSLVDDARDQPVATVQLLKTIGVLNLITTTGQLRATPELVVLALCDDGHREQEGWRSQLAQVQQRGLVTHRRQLNELRLWEGSDFNVDLAVEEQRDQARSPLADLLTDIHPLKPYVAQRHYIQTGTLRYFEQRYGDGRLEVESLTCDPDDDGLILYWLDPKLPHRKPQHTADGKPVVWVQVGQLDNLRACAQEMMALRRIQRTATELQRDGVARREVAYRLGRATELLAGAIAQSLRWQAGAARCCCEGTFQRVERSRQFQALISDLCDRTYPQGLRLDNELINRRLLTTQGSKARRVLMAAMLTASDRPRLGLAGYGPEVAIYGSVLAQTGIHRETAAGWGLGAPRSLSGVDSVWGAIEGFCLGATAAQQSFGALYEELARPPYGVKAGVIPVLIAAVLLVHRDALGLYLDGTFIPMLGAEHFELLVKDPSRFAVKYFAIVGVRSQIFEAIQSLLITPKSPTATRPNPTLLSLITPLYKFVQTLPRYTQTTHHLSPMARQVLRALAQTVEPDTLLFEALPCACELDPIHPTDRDDAGLATLFCDRLTQVLRELNTAHDRLVTLCEDRLYGAFEVQRGEQVLRTELRLRGLPLVGQCSDRLLNGVVRTMVDEVLSDRRWLEAMLMIVADKPTTSWTDETVGRFERSLADVARRFRNLEALQGSMGLESGAPDRTARLLTVTRPDGGEVHRLVWLDARAVEQVAGLVDRVLNAQELQDNPQLRRVLAAQLTEKVLDESLSRG
jgi:hypothetical protein